MTTIAIRPAEPADIPAIAAIYADAVRTGTASFEIEPPDMAEMTRRYQALADNGFPCLVAEVGGEVAGYAYAGPYRTRPAYRLTVEDSIYIAAQQPSIALHNAAGFRMVGTLQAVGFKFGRWLDSVLMQRPLGG